MLGLGDDVGVLHGVAGTGGVVQGHIVVGLGYGGGRRGEDARNGATGSTRVEPGRCCGAFN